MRTVCKLGWAALPAALGILSIISGCGTPGAPMPPSLKLPDPVTDLSALRTGNQVSLTWTMPKKNTDKLLLKGNVAVRVCRKQDEGACEPVAGNLLLAPGADGSFTETLPPELATGWPRKLSYFVELTNRNGRSAGPSNAAVVLAGQAPAAVVNLTAEMRKEGVVLRWTAGSSGPPQLKQASIRLHRLLLTPQSDAKPKSRKGILAPPPEPAEQTLLVEANANGRALDKDIRLSETYEYRAQRVVRVNISTKTGNAKTDESQTLDLELAGPLSDPVRIETLDVFPPAVPIGLAAVATVAGAGTEAAIDLSWQPDTEADLAGYVVYRREGSEGWQRISPTQPVVGPAFHDAHVLAGHSYRYAVSAIDQGGRESARSVETEETVPNP